MRTVGEILAEKRKQLGFLLEEIEKETKIRVKYLQAIEKNDYSSLPESAIAKGFIRNYAQFLGLSPENLLAVFRRDFCENEKGRIIPRHMINLSEKKFYYGVTNFVYWTPKTTFISVVFLLVVGLTAFFFHQYFSFSSAPPLEIFSPREGQVLKEKVEVSGKTDKDATVKIDGILISLTKEGTFKEEIVLPRGENVVTIEAANRQGKKRVVVRKIIME